MKTGRIILAIVLAAALCGCSKKNSTSPGENSDTVVSLPESSTQSEPESSVVTSEVSSVGTDVSKPTSDPNVSDERESFITGITGEKILTTEISTVFSNNGEELTPAQLTRENFSAVLCDGFAYLAEPTGLARNSVDNADVFDENTLEFSNVTLESVSDYKRVNVGESIGGLTLKEAQVNFATGNEMGLPDIAFVYCSAMFDGELTMTGYISRAAEDSYNFMTGDLMFVPSDGESKLPVMSYTYDEQLGYCHSPQYVSSGTGFTWLNEFGYIYLGNAADTTADISGIPDDGSFVKATVTIDRLMMSSGIDRGNVISAEIVDII